MTVSASLELPDELVAAGRRAGVLPRACAELPDAIAVLCRRAMQRAAQPALLSDAVTVELDAVVARLCATIEDNEIEQFRCGRRDGSVWGREHASVRELVILARGAGHAGRDQYQLTGQASLCPSLRKFWEASRGGPVARVPVEGVWVPYWHGFWSGAQDLLTCVSRALVGPTERFDL